MRLHTPAGGTPARVQDDRSRNLVLREIDDVRIRKIKVEEKRKDNANVELLKY